MLIEKDKDTGDKNLLMKDNDVEFTGEKYLLAAADYLKSKEKMYVKKKK